MKAFRSNRSSLLDYAIAERGDTLRSELSLTGVGASLETRFDRSYQKRATARRRSGEPKKVIRQA